MEVARATGLAIDTLRSYDAAKGSAAHNDLLRRLASSLAGSASRADVIDALIHDAIDLLHADAALIAAVTDDRRHLTPRRGRAVLHHRCGVIGHER